MEPIASTPCSTPGTLEVLVVQATPFCDLDCAYCYLPNRSSKLKMSQATLEKLFQSLFASSFVSGNLKILWHAGEPLVLGTAYYQQAFATIDRLNHFGVHLTHSFQTNGTLLNQGWIDLFRRYGVKVGISLDGPSHLHDRHRRTRHGGATFER